MEITMNDPFMYSGAPTAALYTPVSLVPRGRHRPSLAAMAGGVAATVSNIIDGILVTMRRLGTWLFRLGVGVFEQVFRFLQCHVDAAAGRHTLPTATQIAVPPSAATAWSRWPAVDPGTATPSSAVFATDPVASDPPVRVDSPAEGAAPIAAACVQDERPAATSRSTVLGSGAGGVDAAGHMATVTAIESIERLAADASRRSWGTMSSTEVCAREDAVTQALQRMRLTNVSMVRRTLEAVEALAESGADPLGVTYERAATVWGDQTWPTMHGSGAHDLLDASVAKLKSALQEGQGPRARLYAAMLGALAPSLHAGVASRLLWCAGSVIDPLAQAGVMGTPVRDILTARILRWLEQLRKVPSTDVFDVILELWRVPLDACTHEGAIYQRLSGVLRGEQARRDREIWRAH